MRRSNKESEHVLSQDRIEATATCPKCGSVRVLTSDRYDRPDLCFDCQETWEGKEEINPCNTSETITG